MLFYTCYIKTNIFKCYFNCEAQTYCPLFCHLIAVTVTVSLPVVQLQ